MKQINPEHISELKKIINHGPYFELLGMKVCELRKGYAWVEADLQKKHLNPFGVIHGGLYSSIIDTAAYWAMYSELDENIGFTTIDLSINYLSMIREGKIIVEGKTIKTGRSICLAEAYVKDIHGKLLAHGTSKMMVLDGKQSVENIITSMGCRPLPPKFIEEAILFDGI